MIVFDSLAALDFAGWHDPDGRTAAELATVIGQALTEGQFEALTGPRPTSALADGTAAARRDRRIAQRMLGSAVRVLRVHHDPRTAPADSTEGRAA